MDNLKITGLLPLNTHSYSPPPPFLLKARIYASKVRAASGTNLMISCYPIYYKMHNPMNDSKDSYLVVSKPLVMMSAS